MATPRPDRSRALLLGTFDPSHTRNRVMVQLLDAAGWDVAVLRRNLWGAERFSAVQTPRLRLAVRAVATYLALVVRSIVTRRPDIVVFLYPGHIDMLILGPIWKIRGVPIVFDPLLALHDTIVIDRALIRDRTPAAVLIALADRIAFRLADLVLVDTPETGAFYSRRYGVAPAHQLVVWPGTDVDQLGAPTAAPGEERRVLFHGTFIPLHGIDTIVRAAAMSDPDIEFVIVGSGQERPAVEELIANLGGVRNLTLLPPMALAAIGNEIRMASVCLGVFGRTPKADRVVPFKVFEYLALGRPVITGDTEAARNALDGDVVRVPPGDPRALADAVRALVDDPRRRDALGRQGRERFEARFAREPQARALRLALAELTEGRRRAGTGPTRRTGDRLGFLAKWRRNASDRG